jgi:UDP-N-acetylmuramoyl-L-alanyl-D-glutamate--2,6-diaminopimelate ligase
VSASFDPALLQSLGVAITRLVTDSRAVKSGDTFVAYPGERADGRAFIAQALANGANAVIFEARDYRWNPAWTVPHLAVADLFRHAGEIADHVYGHPSGKLWMVGITGTNGKTSCCHWIAQSLCALGKKTALVGTLGNGFPPMSASGEAAPLAATLNTTPDAIRLHGLLHDYLAQGAQAVAMEVSSHALEQGRVNGVSYDVALLTNLSRDHLDYHGDMTRYAAAKHRLFDGRELKFAVLNLDDAFGADLASELQDSAAEVVGYGVSDAALALAERLGLRMVYGSALHMDGAGIRLQVHSSWGGAELASPLIGRFNAENLLGALAVLLVSGVALSDAARALGEVRAVAGRMQRLGGGDRPVVVVDYAHTPDALEKVLQALREVADARRGRLVCVFGCGGDRDRGKRALMGAIAARLSDSVIVTSDNPRSEAAGEIIATIVAGMGGGWHYHIVEDRAHAIAHAIRNAKVQDTVLLAGKGHEVYQEIKGVKYPFSDMATAAQELAAWHGGSMPA